jgi:hypothetical protein
MHTGLAAKLPHAGMRIPADPTNAPWLVAQVLVVRPQDASTQPMLQADLVCCEALISTSGSDQSVEMHRRPVLVRSVPALGERPIAYGAQHPQLSAGLPFVDIQAMESLDAACKAQVRLSQTEARCEQALWNPLHMNALSCCELLDHRGKTQARSRLLEAGDSQAGTLVAHA